MPSGKKKKKKRVFVSTSHTPPERLSDDETSKASAGSSPKHLHVPTATSVIPVPSPPHVIPRSRSPNGSDVIGLSPVGGSAPVRSSAFEGGCRSVTPDQAMTPTSAGSKSQSPHSSGSDLAIHDWSGSSSPKSTGSGGGRKPPPPPKPRLLPSKFDDRSLEIQRSSTLPWNKAGSASPRVAGKPRVPLKPTMPGSVPDISNSGSHGVVTPVQQVGEAAGSSERSGGKKSPPKPRRNFVTRALSQPNLPDSPLPASAGTSVATPTGSGNSDAIETPPTLDSSTVASSSQSEVPPNKTPPTPRQRPPPKPARSIKRKPQRDRVKPEGEDLTPTKVETENVVPSTDKNLPENSPRNLTPPPSNDVAARPPKPFRRLRSPKVIDSLTNQEKEKRDESFDGEQSSVDRESSSTAVNRTINVSTPSPTSSCPTTITNEGAGSFASEAAVPIHDVTTTTEHSKSPVPRSGSAGSSSGGGSPKTGKPRPLPKPRALQASKTSSSTSRTPGKPAPPSKPARASIRVATPDLS